MADRLFLIEPGFEDPACLPPEQAETCTLFVCPECLPLEGLLALYPKALADLDVVRVPFERPRQEVAAIFGEGNQSLPKLLLDHSGAANSGSPTHEKFSVVDGPQAILSALCQRYSVPAPHC